MTEIKKPKLCPHCRANQYTQTEVLNCRTCGLRMIKTPDCDCDYCFKEKKSEGDHNPEPSLNKVIETLGKTNAHLKGRGDGSVKIESKATQDWKEWKIDKFDCGCEIAFNKDKSEGHEIKNCGVCEVEE